MSLVSMLFTSVGLGMDAFAVSICKGLSIKKYNLNKLFTVGRLDVDTTGLLLITSDGEVAHKLTSPKNDIKKVYYVKCDKEFPENANDILHKGVLLKDKDGEAYLSKPSSIELINSNEGLITVSEGKFHEVKRLCLSMGLKVLELHRKQIGNIMLDDNLQIGEYKEIDNIPEKLDSDDIEQEMVFVGLVGMIDPARPEVKDAVALCRKAGIRPIMITGDHKDTAIAIAKDIGILVDESEAVMGNELDKYTDEEFKDIVMKF